VGIPLSVIVLGLSSREEYFLSRNTYIRTKIL
jgi:hypothetical protein